MLFFFSVFFLIVFVDLTSARNLQVQQANSPQKKNHKNASNPGVLQVNVVPKKKHHMHHTRHAPQPPTTLGGAPSSPGAVTVTVTVTNTVTATVNTVTTVTSCPPQTAPVAPAAPEVPAVPASNCAPISSATRGSSNVLQSWFYGNVFSVSGSTCDATYSCWMSQINKPSTCFSIFTYLDTRCTIDASGSSYICATDLNAIDQNVACTMPIPSGLFTVNFIGSGCFLGQDRYCHKVSAGSPVLVQSGGTIHTSNGQYAFASNGNGVTCDVSPLVLDMNHDGIVEATAGMGLDLNLDGIAEGAATGGDKMMAMSDLNGNNQIDGAEVFGDTTISPFTKKPYHAANGFEALRKVAKEAEQVSHASIIKSNLVDVIKLKDVLASHGVKLGFVSGNDNTIVHDLYGVKYINLTYENNNDNGIKVARKQKGTFIDFDDKVYAIDDVWFQTI